MGLSLREQLLKKAKSIEILAKTYSELTLKEPEDDYQKARATNEIWIHKDDVLRILAPFLELSPKTTEMQKLLENFRKKIKQTLDIIDYKGKISPVMVEENRRVNKVFEDFVPKLEALLTDHDRTKTELEKLIEDLAKRIKRLESYSDSHPYKPRLAGYKQLLKRFELLTKKGV